MTTFTRRSLVQGTAGFSLSALLAAHPLARVTRAAGDAEYDFIDFGPFDIVVGTAGGGSIRRLNQAGVSCGWIGVSTERRSPAVWSKTGKLKRLKSSKFGGIAYDLNIHGTVVGVEYPQTQGQPRAVLWQDGERIILPGLNGTESLTSATSINDDGVITGIVWNDTGIQIVRWTDQVAEPLPFPDGMTRSLSAATRINAQGTIATIGETTEGDPPRRDLVLFKDNDAAIIARQSDAIHDIAGAMVLQGFNNVGQALIIAFDMEAIGYVTWRTDGDEELVIDQRADGIDVFGQDLNDHGEIVGATSAKDADQSIATLWRNGEAINLNDRITNQADLTLTNATSINNDGLIAGMANDGDKVSHGVLLVPTK